MNIITSLLQAWLAREPIANRWLAAAATGLVLAGIFRLKDVHWKSRLRYIPISLVNALVFIGLVWSFYFLLYSDALSFNQVFASFTTGGSLSNQAWQKWRTIYGGNFTQEDLQVTQFILAQNGVTTSLTPSSTLPNLADGQIWQPIPQNSIASFDGQLTVNVADPVRQQDTFNGFVISADYIYQIENSSNQPTRVEFKFPLSQDATLYQDIRLETDGVPVADWNVIQDNIVWNRLMKPDQKSIVRIHYLSWGMDGFVFDVPTARPIGNFKLRLALNTDNC